MFDSSFHTQLDINCLKTMVILTNNQHMNVKTIVDDLILRIYHRTIV
jgi:hypothetical protein